MKHCILFFGFCLGLNPLFAQNWTGAINSDWNNPANWSVTPTNGDDIVIDPANYTGAMAQPLINGNSNFTPAEMLVQNGAQLTISGTLNASDRVEIIGNGTLVTITNTGAFSLTGGGNNARLIFVDDAHLEMNGGNLSVGQRLLFELGATGNIHAGNVIVGETIALVDGSATGSSKLVQNGGMITTNAEFGFENEAGIYFPTFLQTGGSIQINGSLLWLGVAPGAGTGYFRSTGGSVFVTGSIGNDPASTMNMHLEFSGNTAVMNNSGTTVDLLTGDSIVLNHHATWTDLGSATWTNNGSVYAADTSLFQSGNSTLNGTGNYQFDFVTIPGGKTLNHLAPAAIQVSGDFSVSGSFNHSTNILELNGTKNQQITSSSNNLQLYGLRVQNSANGPADGGYGIALNTGITVSGSLELNDGRVVCAANAPVKVLDNVLQSGQSDSTFIVGTIEKTGDDAFVFPVGTLPDRYRPLHISAPVSTGTQIKVTYLNNAYSSLTPVEAPMQSVSALEYWDFIHSNATDPVAVTVGWNNATESGITDCADISLSVWNGTKWAFLPSGTSGLCNGTGDGTLYSVDPLPVNGPITIGFTSNVTQQVVNLCYGDSITIGSNTYSLPGTYLDVLQDINGDDSTVVSVIHVSPLLLNSVTDNIVSITADVHPLVNNLQWVNCLNGFAEITGETATTFTPAQNGSYAVIASYNGCSDTSACVLINQLSLPESQEKPVVLFPNPVTTGGELILLHASMKVFSIQSMDGKTIQPLSTRVEGEKCILLLPPLPAGIYRIPELNQRFTVY